MEELAIIETRLNRIESNVQVLEVRHNDFHKSLLGNGRPGLLERMESRFSEELEEHSKTAERIEGKLAKMEDKLGKVMLAIGVLAASAGAGGVKVLEFLL